MKNFKVNDWCFCEFKLQQILSMKDGKVTEVSDGAFRMSGNDLTDRCYPVDMKIKQCSDTVAYWSHKLHELKHNSLNHPDLNRELISRWVEICENINDGQATKILYEKLDSFGRAVVSRVQDLKYEEIEGVRLFTR